MLHGIHEPKKGFDPLWFQQLFEVEDRHFWFRARNRVIAEALQEIVKGLPHGYRVLEIGCGTGNTLRVLKRFCEDGYVVGMDLFLEGLQFTRTRSCNILVQGDAAKPPFCGKFHVIAAFDLLEDLQDDITFLLAMHSLLVEKGTIVVTVPAHQSLWSRFDESSHRQRYELKELESKLVNTGYTIEYITEYMCTIYPLVWLSRKLTGLLSATKQDGCAATNSRVSPELRIVPVLNGILYSLLWMESLCIRRRIRLPIGTSILAVARKTTPQ